MVQPLRTPATPRSEGSPSAPPLEHGGAAARARTPGPDRRGEPSQRDRAPDTASADLDRLRRQVQQQRLALVRLSDALTALRRGTVALREENRELRHALDAARRTARGPGGPAAS